METKKRRKFREIFAVLDSDNDGTINAQKVSISGIEPGLLELISPLLCAMEDQDKTYDLSGFYAAAEELYLSLPPPDKIRLLDEAKKKKKEEGIPLFQPELNQKSLKMAARSENRGKNVAERLMQSKLVSEGVKVENNEKDRRAKRRRKRQRIERLHIQAKSEKRHTEVKEKRLNYYSFFKSKCSHQY